jgi:hypothetical protein
MVAKVEVDVLDHEAAVEFLLRRAKCLSENILNPLHRL